MEKETDYIQNKKTSKVYISKRIEHTTQDGEIIPLRYVSKIINSEKILGDVKEKGVIQLRITDSGKQEILAKVLEINNKIYVLTLQRYSKATGSPHKMYFSFVGKEIKELRDFLDSIVLLQFPDDKKSRIEQADISRLKNIFYKNPDIKLIEETLKQNITDKDIVAVGYRKYQLEIFRKLLYENFLDDYKKDVVKNDKIKDEVAWQYFFNKNSWIFGYGLDYRFQGVLQKEFQVTGGEADGSNRVFGDFLLGDKKFVTFVELKKPETKIFGFKKNRSNSWKLSNDLTDATSQILEQKASGQVRLETETLHDDRGNEIRQKPYDSKTILIIGNWNELESASNDLEKKIKIKTFELFRRDSRNIEIITYDELYERAQFIVNDNK
ncbi:DUF4263 domain-containing protein [Candidatus Parcubacteria bacterium]|nr:DUF4263 domain-containing protein [Candidatus Parcubacteria bacterium]